MSNQKLVLIGDSILDNAPYTTPEPDTTTHLQNLLGSAWSVELLAMDGAVMADVPRQVRALHGRPDVAVLSVGGNDAIQHVDLLERRGTSSADVFKDLLEIVDDFEHNYEKVARMVAEHAHRTVLCTIYEVRLEPAIYAKLVRVPLAVLNDRIISIGARLGVDVIDLRAVCTDDADFVLQIEPSATGAARIAQAIASLLERGVAPARLYAPALGE